MKKIILILSLLFIIVSVNAQVPTDPTDLQNKINTWIVTNGNKQITATQVHDLLTGINNLMLKYSVNNAYRINDTLFLTGPNLTTIKVTMSAGSGGDETDPTVPLVVKAITSTNISTWNSKQAALTPGSTIDITSNVITAKNTLPLWNANQKKGHAESSANPTNGQTYVWNSSTSQFEPVIITGNNIYTSNGTLTGSPRTLTGVGGQLKFNNIGDFLISTNNQKHVWITDSLNNTQMYMGPGCCFGTGLQRGSTIISQSLTSSTPFFTLAMDSGFSSMSDQFGNNITLAGPTEGTPGLIFNGVGGNYFIYGIPSTTDTTKKALVYDPVFQTLSYMDLWSRAAGGGNPFADNIALIKNNSDNTKRVTIGAVNVSTSTTRILQSPDANGTIVLNDNTATLTNKTIAAGSNTLTGLTNSNLSGSAAISNTNLANSTITINGSSTSLGGSATVTDANLSTSNITTNNASTSKHGFVPILPNDATKYYDGTGNYSTPPGGAITKQTISASSTASTGSKVNLFIDPSSVVVTLAVTTEASPSDGDVLTIFGGGTITGGAPVVNNFSMIGGGGWTFNLSSPIPTSLNAGSRMFFIANTTHNQWYGPYF